MTLELSNVANLPITIYYGMKIGQLSFVQMTEPAEDAVRVRSDRLEIPGPERPDCISLLAELRRGAAVILVTGGTGFVGGHVVHALRADGRDVRCLVRDRRRGERLQAWGCELAEGDVTRPESLHAAVAGCDTVVHLVAIRQGRPEQFQRVMIDGTRNLLGRGEGGRRARGSSS